MNHGANYKKTVDKIVKELLNSRDVEAQDLTRTLNKSFRRLEDTSYAEREAMREILVTNLALSKVVGELIIVVNNINGEIERLKSENLPNGAHSA